MQLTSVCQKEDLVWLAAAPSAAMVCMAGAMVMVCLGEAMEEAMVWLAAAPAVLVCMAPATRALVWLA
jgi:hypothetical protein